EDRKPWLSSVEDTTTPEQTVSAADRGHDHCCRRRQHGCAGYLLIFHRDGRRRQWFRSRARDTRADHPCTCVRSPNDADDRWRDVLFAMIKRANRDPDFRARVEASGAVLDHFEAVMERMRLHRDAPVGGVACRDYWWGFQLTIPHAILVDWTDGTTDSGE